MDWGRRLLMKMEATAHKTRELDQVIEFECGLVAGVDIRRLGGLKRLDYHGIKEALTKAFTAYLDTGDIDAWDFNVRRANDDLRALGRV